MLVCIYQCTPCQRDLEKYIRLAHYFSGQMWRSTN